MQKCIFTIRLYNSKTDELGPVIYSDNRPKTNKACSREADRIMPTLMNVVKETENWAGLRTDFIKYEGWM